MLLNDQRSNLTCQRSWQSNHLLSWRSCQETLFFQASYTHLSPREHVWRFLCVWALSDVHHDPAARGWLFQVDVEQSVFSLCVRPFWIRRCLYSEPTAWNPARREPKSDLHGLPGELLLLSSDRTVCVCVWSSMCMSYFVFKLLFPHIFFSHQAYGQHENIVYTWSTLDFNVWATACMFSALCLLCYCMNICVMVSRFIVWKHSVTSVCACERLCGLRNHWYIIFPVCVSPEYLAIV